MFELQLQLFFQAMVLQVEQQSLVAKLVVSEEKGVMLCFQLGIFVNQRRKFLISFLFKSAAMKPSFEVVFIEGGEGRAILDELFEEGGRGSGEIKVEALQFLALWRGEGGEFRRRMMEVSMV